jgi:hypothetical protein
MALWESEPEIETENRGKKFEPEISDFHSTISITL